MCPITLLLVAKKAHKCCRLCPRGHLTKLTYNLLLPEILCGTRQSINKLLAYWGVSSHTGSSGVWLRSSAYLHSLPKSLQSYLSCSRETSSLSSSEAGFFFRDYLLLFIIYYFFFRDWSSLLALVSSSKSLSLFPSLLSSARLCSLLLSACWDCFILQLPSLSCSYIFIDSLLFCLLINL